MYGESEFYLYEEIMLLALRDDKGTIATGSMYQYAVSASIIAELLFHSRIRIEESRRKLVNLVDSTPFGDPLLDECLEKIRTAKRRASLQTWVSRFSNIKQLKHRIARKLVQRGVLRADEDTILGIFKRKIYPEINPEPEVRLIERLRQAIFTELDEIDARTVILLSLAHHADLLKIAFEKKALKSRKKRIEKIINGELTGKAAQEAIQAMQAAVMVAVMVPAITASAASH